MVKIPGTKLFIILSSTPLLAESPRKVKHCVINHSSQTEIWITKGESRVVMETCRNKIRTNLLTNFTNRPHIFLRQFSTLIEKWRSFLPDNFLVNHWTRQISQFPSLFSIHLFLGGCLFQISLLYFRLVFQMNLHDFLLVFQMNLLCFLAVIHHLKWIRVKYTVQCCLILKQNYKFQEC